MKKKTLSLLFSFLITGTSLMAQSSQGLIPFPTAEELRRETLFELQPIHAGVENTGSKPTADKQRLVASTIVNDTTGMMSLRDTALFTYSGLRGSVPSAQTGNITVLSDFDTSYAYTVTDNFAAPVPRASKKYDAESRLIFSYNYANNGEMIYREWNEYYNTDTFMKSGSWKKVNATDYIYKDKQFSASGKVLVDTFSQVVPSVPGPNYNWDKISTFEYDAQDRLVSAIKKTNTYNPGGVVAATYTYSIWYFYDNASQMFPAKDSAIMLTELNGNPQSPQLYRTYYTYDGSNNLLLSKTYTGDPQELSWQTTNAFNASSKLLSTLYESFYNNQMNGANRTINQYSNDVLTLSTTSSLDINSNTWNELSKTVYHLNSSELVDSMAFYNSNLISTTTYTYNNFRNIIEQKQISYDNNNVAHTSITHNYYSVFDDGTPSGLDNVYQSDLKVSIFPNPATDLINIDIQDLKGNATVSISNLNGIVLGNETINAAHAKIDFSAYVVGIYFIKVSSKEGASIKKIVKH